MVVPHAFQVICCSCDAEEMDCDGGVTDCDDLVIDHEDCNSY